MKCPYCSGKKKSYWTRRADGKVIHGIFGANVAVHDEET